MSLIEVAKKVIKEDLRLEGIAVENKHPRFEEIHGCATVYIGKIRLVIYDSKNNLAAGRESAALLRGTRLACGEHVYASGNREKYRWYAIADNGPKE